MASRAVECGAEGVDGLALEAESEVGAAGEFLDYDEFDVPLQKQGRGRMAEVVEADAAEVGLAKERGEGTAEAGRVDRSALHGGEHVPVALSRRACGLAFALSLLTVELQRVDAARGESDSTF
ncbi:hypothetical protein SU9_033690 [Streptomyces auratus AGR0001]|uniref:Uncharacterized protein n=1 Tax=Streptomyces auratus AGR0001 TaxID=1160718 RepID=A0A8B1NQL0_9ACTN|nr:hypothetical protein SU9_033690 [Streptomyces auratus AGR0001]